MDEFYCHVKIFYCFCQMSDVNFLKKSFNPWQCFHLLQDRQQIVSPFPMTHAMMGAGTCSIQIFCPLMKMRTVSHAMQQLVSDQTRGEGSAVANST